MSRSFESRFWAHVDRSGGEDSCWPWTGAKNRFGYGNFGASGRKTVLSHRMAFEISHGPLGDLHCLHRCDNPPCCNPKHLFPGTHAENMADRNAKGRTRPGKISQETRKRIGEMFRGEKNPNAKIDDEGACLIKRLFFGKEASAKQLAHRFNVSNKQIYNIVNGKRRLAGDQS